MKSKRALNPKLPGWVLALLLMGFCQSLSLAAASYDAIARGRRFLVSLLDPNLDLLPEYRGAKVYWIYHDNFLASKVLAQAHPEISQRIAAAMAREGVRKSGKIEMLFGEADRPLPFHQYELKDVRKVEGRLLRTEVVTDRILEGWEGYADLLLLASIAEPDRKAARKHWDAAMRLWDGKGFLDAAAKHDGRYSTYKLGLALLAARRFSPPCVPPDELKTRLLSLQDESGGWITDYDAAGKRIGVANVETTSLCILGLDERSEYLVGIYYFAGWWQKSPNKWEIGGRDWRPEYRERIPLLGEYNNQATMDREILAAAAHGVDFFQILWYPDGGPLNEGLRAFMASTNAARMKFTIEFVNHPPFELAADADWDAASRLWCAAMQQPSYLRLDGRPVFKIHGLDFFYRQNGDDAKRVAARLERFGRIAEEHGLSKPLISGGVMPGGVPQPERAAPFDFLTTYMDMPDLPQRSEPYPYDLLLRHGEYGWRRYAEHSSKPYVPYVPSGWDPRPWRDARPSFAFPTKQEWIEALERVRTTLQNHSNLGIPVKAGRKKMLLIYSWNEFGEGGMVAPTEGEKEMKLNGVQEVFGVR